MSQSHPAPKSESSNGAAASGATEAAAGVRISTGDLFGSAREIVLVHNGREYRLRITQQGKLLLTA